MILIYPPIAKATEPPAGISILSNILSQNSIKHSVFDFNLEGQLYLLNRYFEDFPKKAHYLKLIRDKQTFSNYDKYQKVISELNRGISYNNNSISLANVNSSDINPLNSKDLIRLVTHYNNDIFFELYEKRLKSCIKENSYTYIGISLQFINQIIPTFNLIGYLKRFHPELKIVLGGGLITSWASLYDLNDLFKELDLIIMPGKGEDTIAKLFDIKSSEREFCPDYSYSEKYNYLSPGKILPILTSYGCSWCRCKFCPELAEGNKFYVQKNNIFKSSYIALINKYKPQLVHFLDNEISPAKLNIIKEIKGADWYGFTKFYSNLETIEYCMELKESGCVMLKLGLESGDQQVLDSMDKGIKIDNASIILKNLRDVGIKTFVYILLGTPTEDYNSALKTKTFLKDHYDCISYINIAIFNLPIKNTLNLKEIKKEYGDLSLYTDFDHPLGWNKSSIRSFIKKEFMGDPDIKQIIQRTPKVFNANHAAFF